tara:strand:- start:10053 stop:10718 length:666 start_codon:yes stop_codon:yes gene_type:complete
VLKRIIDILLSLLIIISFLPFGLIIIIILNLSGEGEVFYKQIRIGKNGKEFGLIKFATMVKNSPNMGMGDITVKNDPRVLPFGKILRKTKLNEFPQFLNVLIGDMSLVGPRPLVKNQYDMIPDNLLIKIKNLKPGVTGIGSIIFRDEEKYFSKIEDPKDFYKNQIVPFKSELEYWYSKKKSIIVDILLIILTIIMIIFPKSNIYKFCFRSLPNHVLFNPEN